MAVPCPPQGGSIVFAAETQGPCSQEVVISHFVVWERRDHPRLPPRRALDGDKAGTALSKGVKASCLL